MDHLDLAQGRRHPFTERLADRGGPVGVGIGGGVEHEQHVGDHPAAVGHRHHRAVQYVRAALERQGVSSDEAKARVNAMSDDEVERLAARFDSLPAGGSGLETFLVIGFLVFVTLLVTDILGFTKVFSFTRPAK